MATARKKIEPAAPSRFAQLVAEAREKQEKITPYVFDGVDPAVEIHPPTTVEQVTAVAAIMDRDDDFDVSQVMHLFEIVCGDAFPQVWAAIKDEPIELLFLLVGDMNKHFNAVPENGDDLPGGA